MLNVEVIKTKRQSNGWSQKHLAQLISVSPATMQRMEDGTKKSITLEESILISKAFKTTLKNIIDEKHFHLLGDSGILHDASIVEFDNEEDLTDHLVDIESEGRLAILNFPSTIYERNTGRSQERFKNFLSSQIENKEFYSIQSFLNFGFSPCSPCSDQEKINILDKMTEMFDFSHNNQIFMFSQERNYSDIEILYKKSSLVFMLPIINTPAVAAIIIDSKDITNDFCMPYLQEDSSLIRGHEIKKIISILKVCIEKENSSLFAFYKRCKKETTCASTLKECLNPSVQERLP